MSETNEPKVERIGGYGSPTRNIPAPAAAIFNRGAQTSLKYRTPSIGAAPAANSRRRAAADV